MSANLLSVVRPTCNRPGRPGRVAPSVHTGLATEIEPAIVDDASTDETPRITARPADDVTARLGGDRR